MTNASGSPRLPLTAAQTGLWYAQQLDPANPVYAIAEYIEIEGPLDVATFRAAVRRAVLETDAIHLRFGEEDGRPWQQVDRPDDWQLTVVDLTGETDPAEAARAWMRDDLAQPLDVHGGALFAEVLFSLGPEHYFVYQRVHHLLLDGYGAVLVLGRITEIYDALVAGTDPGPAPFGSFTDLLDADAAYPGSPQHADDLEFWRERTAGTEEPVGLAGTPARMPRTLLRATAHLSRAEAKAVLATARAHQTGMPAAILTATAVYLHRLTGARDITLGLPVTARKGGHARSVPAMLSNIVPLRVRVRPDAPVGELLREVAAETRAVLRHQRFRYEDLLRAEGAAGRRLTGPSVNMLPVAGTMTFAGLPATAHNLAIGPVDDLSVIVHGVTAERDIRVDFDANPDLYAAEDLADHQRRFLDLLGAFAAAPETPVGALALLAEPERTALLESGRAPERERPAHTVVAEFQQRARQTPGATALVAPDTRLTFAELDARSNQLARHLLARGARPGTIVAVRLPRCADLAVALLAVLKSGAAYLPLDPGYPADRLAAMTADARPVLTLAHTGTAAHDAPGTVVLDDADTRAALKALADTTIGAGERPRPITPADLAYVIYTSGSTGRPKGVAVEHGSLLNLFHSHREQVFGPARERAGRPLRVAHTAGLSFDASWDPILWLAEGNELHLVPDEVRRDPQALMAHLHAARIDAIETTPSFARALLGEGLATPGGPTVVALGGEAVDADLWRALAALDHVRAYNFYGPTETTVDSLIAPITADTEPDIGRPVPNTRAYVLDSGLHAVPDGAPGELYLSGANLARGYLDRPALTGERFVADPFAADGARMYRTGDVVRRRPDATLQFLGRADDQVKIRGFRVEPGEIEAVLLSHPDVEQSAVVVRTDAGDPRLVGYVTGTADPVELREHTARMLPGHMVPAQIMALDTLPLTPNGKLDRAALPRPDVTGTAGAREPGTPEETLLRDLFADTLGLDEVGVDDDFFALGGHSLLATRLIGRIRDALGTAPPIRDLFEHPTVAGLATRLLAGGTDRPVLAPRERPERIPLSYAQRRLWFLNRYDPASPAYNIPAALRLRGDLDPAALRGAVADLVDRHESLRTVFPWTEEEPRQNVLAATDAGLDYAAVSCTEADLARLLRAESARGFDTSAELPLRVRLFRLDSGEHVLLLVLHHIAGDGWSLAPLARDLAAAYSARVTGGAPALAPLPVQYADYTLWQREALGDEDDPDSDIARQLAFWRRTLAGTPEELALPTDRPRPAEPSGRGGAVPVELPARLHRDLAALARSRGASLFMVLQAGLAALLTRLGAGEDLPIGTPVAGRTDPALDDLVGFFVNTLVLRTDTSGNPTMGQLVDRVRATDLAAYAHQDAPFERVVEEVRPARSAARHPLFQTMLTLQNTPEARLEMPGLHVGTEPGADSGAAKFDLSLSLAERFAEDGTPAGVAGTLEYSGDLFDASSVRVIADRLVRVFQALAADPDTPLSETDILAPGELRALEAGARGPVRAVPDTTIVGLFTDQARRTPGATAVVAGNQRLTFADLDARSDRLARVLAGHGTGTGDVVAVLLPRSADTVVALLGVLKSGAAYLPVDLSYPSERIAHMLADSRPAQVVTGAAATVDIAVDAPVLRLDDLPLTVPRCPAPVGPAAHDLAYVVYTSGSTGRPKGVAVEHRALANLFYSHREQVFGPARERAGRPLRMAHTAGVSFDAAWDPILWLVDGHELHVIDDETRGDAERLTAHLHAVGADAIETTPAYARQLAALGLFADGVGPRVVALGGEAVDPALWRTLREVPGLTAHNFYGPTEATVDSVTASGDDEPEPVIGRPVANVGARVLDARLRPVPAGVVGELYLTGAGLARGYLGRPALTAERFIADPVAADGTRMYRTGDLVSRRPDGALRFVGRVDDQVKIRGFRIEPGEIEAVLAEHPDVAQAAAVVGTSKAGDPRLVAYATARPGTRLDTADVRARAAERLPDYMVPVAVVELAELPLTPNGKLDRAALPEPEPGPGQGRPPRGGDESLLCGLFAEVLGVPTVGADDDFFALGGHSLLAVRLIARVRAVMGVELEIRTLFQQPTAARLAAALDSGQRAQPPLRPMPRPERLPLSPAQQRLWFLNRMDDTAADYNIAMAVRLTGELDTRALRLALGDVTARHESLRTVFPDLDGVAHQHVLAPEEAAPPLLMSFPGSEEALRAEMARVAGTGFDLVHQTPLRAHLFRLRPDEHVLLLVLHHIAGDGWSTAPLARDLSTAYTARVHGTAALCSDLTVQYADYALWQRSVLGEESDPASPVSRSLDAWQQRLAGAPEELRLPADRPRPASSAQPAATVAVRIDAALHRRLLDLARGSSASLFMVLQTGLAALYTRLGAGEDIVLGSPVAGRTDPALDDLVGFFVNTLALRTDTSGNPGFAELLERVRAGDLDAFDDQDVPFERVVERLRPSRSLGRHPLFQTMLTLQNTETPTLELPGLDVRPEPEVSGGAAKFDLSFSLAESEDHLGAADGILGTLEFSTAMFDAATATTIAERYVRLLEAAAANPRTPIGRLDILTRAERTGLLEKGRGPERVAPAATVVDLFEYQAQAAPRAVAVVAGGERLDFGTINARANLLARTLVEQGTGPGDVVGVLLPRSAATVVALLGVLKSGAAYLPLDPDSPDERLAGMLDDAGPAQVITVPELRERFAARHPALFLGDTAPGGPSRPGAGADLSDTERVRPLSGTDTAYVIYTSGSTGRPKGVEVEHAALVNLFASHRAELFAPTRERLGRRPRVAHTAGVAFDASWDPMLWLVDGHELHVIGDDVRRDSAGLVRYLAHEGIDAIETTPSHIRRLLAEGLLDGDRGPGVVALGGEAVDADLWRTLTEHAGVRAYNFYGPTETTVDSLVAPIEVGQAPTIGRPVGNSRAYVLDGGLHPAPVGAVGELYIAGAGLARGYRSRPALTGERFVADPFAPAGERMYRTGDLARWRADGTLEFMGRADDQVKVRGFRIEPGEISAVLAEHPDVAEAAVVAHTGDNAGTRLVAYVVGRTRPGPGPDELRRHLAATLPEYMMPALFVPVEGLPLTPNGKLDRAALPDPGEGAATDRIHGVPRTPREAELCTLFASALDLPRVGVHDGFFELGGHSLLAPQLAARVGEALGAPVTVRMLFQAPTVAELLAAVDDGAEEGGLDRVLALRPTGSATPLFCVHPAGGLAWSYSGLMRHLGTEHPIYGLQAPGLVPGERDADPAATLTALADDYIDHMQRVQPEGPYHILGWSFGGNIAHALAARLRERGEQVDTLAILDAYPTKQESNADFGGESAMFAALVHALGYEAEPEELVGLDATKILEIFHRNHNPMSSLDEATIRSMVHSFGHHAALLRTEEPARFDGDLLFFTATLDRNPGDPLARTWEPYVSGAIEDHPVECAHAQMTQDGPLSVIGPVLADRLERAVRNAR
ncbi:non-ribosomal peptide synthetase [Nocardiopsis ansamitocini]|uniref:Non-ribosomal peptide synthetase n=1 Tax=Nocardiopsis ansamitocini TaxID=1670832 RepID=A0A9W6UL53_9ACTN|nr:non-ribosomal peptide synthetase [Nocardiopsis ansamitocini]GLU50313.1 non-ribosomal peptide synthetase [Nocardiopsis ansamitocini]